MENLSGRRGLTNAHVLLRTELQIALKTGGRVFHIDRKTTLDDAFKDIQEEMRSQYALGYSSTNAKKDGSYRKLEIRMSNKDQKVQARKGYYAVEREN